nr:VOC family protein [Aminobacter carboxidus]
MLLHVARQIMQFAARTKLPEMAVIFALWAIQPITSCFRGKRNFRPHVGSAPSAPSLGHRSAIIWRAAMKIVNYLFFNGNCREAFEFYAKVFDGEIVGMLTHRETPASKDVSEEWQDKIINAQLVIGDQSIMASDSPPQYRTEMSGFSVSVDIDDLARAERIFAALADGGTINMPFSPTFWAKGFGMVKDTFGTPWMISSGNAGE